MGCVRDRLGALYAFCWYVKIDRGIELSDKIEWVRSEYKLISNCLLMSIYGSVGEGDFAEGCNAVRRIAEGGIVKHAPILGVTSRLGAIGCHFRSSSNSSGNSSSHLRPNQIPRLNIKGLILCQLQLQSFGPFPNSLHDGRQRS